MGGHGLGGVCDHKEIRLLKAWGPAKRVLGRTLISEGYNKTVRTTVV